ncbi:MAG: cellulase family glycosylhydrolase [Bacteroidales bacterium]|nr:cellulase family glycosylhydrolase [Bacteroidales bacterium]
MKKLWLRFLAVSFFVMISALTHSQTVVDAYGKLKIEGTKIISESGSSVQLRGMSFFWSQWQGKYYTYNTVKWLRDDWKCTIVRAAMGIQQGGYMTNPALERQKVEAVVDAAIDLGIYVIIDWHSHTAEGTVETDSAVSFFSAMAKKYAAYPNVIYEIYNEPLQVSWASVVKPYHLKVIEAIRKYDKENIIVCGTPTWSQDVDIAAQSPITGYKNIAYTLHYYAASHKKDLRDKATIALNKGICLFVTEFGTCKNDGGNPIDTLESRLWFEFMDKHEISWCNWSIADKVEAASAIPPGASPDGNWDPATLTVSGTIVRTELIKKWKQPEVVLSAPKFSLSPQNQTVSEGATVKLTASAYGVEPITFQWYKNGEILENQTDDTLLLENISQTAIGQYYVVATNEIGSIQSVTSTVLLGYQKAYKDMVNFIPGIVEAENYDEGGEGIAYYDASLGNAGNKYRTDNVDIEATTDISAGFNLGWTDTGDWLEYSINAKGAGDYSIELRVAANGAAGSFRLLLDGEVIVPITSVASTGGWQTWITLALPDKVTIAEGNHILRLEIVSGGFNLNNISFGLDTYTDCNNDSKGSAYIDDCGTCVGGNTGLVPCSVQIITVAKGWSLLPLFIETPDMSIDKMFPVISIIKDNDSLYFDRSKTPVDSNFSTLSAGSAYKVYSPIAHSVQVKGTVKELVNTKVKAGWNLVAVPLNNDMLIEDYPANVKIIKDFDSFYDKNDIYDKNTSIKSGKAYYLNADADGEIIWKK